MNKYRKKPVIVEAVRFPEVMTELESSVRAFEIYRWIERNTLGSFEPMSRIEGRKPWPASGVTIDPRDGRMVIATLEGGHWVEPGDWIIQGVKGEFYPCKPDVFAATYEPAEESEAKEWT